MNAPMIHMSEPISASEIVLTPVQQRAYDKLKRFAQAAPAVAIVAEKGLGKTILLRRFAADYGGEFLSLEDCLEGVKLRDPEACDEAMCTVIAQALNRTDVLLIDGMDMVGMSSGARDTANRLFFEHMLDKGMKDGKRIIMSSSCPVGDWLATPTRVPSIEIEPFRAADYGAFAKSLRGPAAADALDADHLFRAAAGLNGHDLKLAYLALKEFAAPDSDQLIDALRAYVLGANTKTHEVEELSFDSLPGTEHISSKLETHIIMPLENQKLARELGIKPKRGVLLYGPPGTGKTSIGRALAHRMKGRFFLIDGSVVTEPPAHFFGKVKAIVEEAKENAPCVLFVDDADVLFGIVHISGLVRYLLSLLDGMESETAGKVCLMMTAMDPKRVPSAILRSGRVELWLETRAPDLTVRAQILKRWLGEGLPGLDTLDLAEVAGAAERFTAADLRRIVSDAKAYFAADDVAGRAAKDAQAYLLRAIDELIATRARMADNLKDDSLRIGTIGDTKAKYGTGIGGLVEAGYKCVVSGW